MCMTLCDRYPFVVLRAYCAWHVTSRLPLSSTHKLALSCHSYACYQVSWASCQLIQCVFYFNAACAHVIEHTCANVYFNVITTSRGLYVLSLAAISELLYCIACKLSDLCSIFNWTIFFKFQVIVYVYYMNATYEYYVTQVYITRHNNEITILFYEFQKHSYYIIFTRMHICWCIIIQMSNVMCAHIRIWLVFVNSCTHLVRIQCQCTELKLYHCR